MASSAPAPSRRPSASGCPVDRSTTRCVARLGARTLRVLIHPQRGVVVTIPSSARRGWGAPGTARRVVPRPSANRGCGVISRARPATGRTSRLGAGCATGRRSGTAATCTGSGSSPRRPGARRSSVERVGGIEEDEIVVRLAPSDRRSTAALLEAWFKPRARVAIDREIARHADALRGHARSRSASATSARGGGARRGRAGCPSRGA